MTLVFFFRAVAFINQNVRFVMWWQWKEVDLNSNLSVKQFKIVVQLILCEYWFKISLKQVLQLFAWKWLIYLVYIILHCSSMYMHFWHSNLEMDSLQNSLSFEYKCSIFFAEMHCIICQSIFEVGRNRSQSFYFNMKFGPPKSANQKPPWYMIFWPSKIKFPIHPLK